MKTLNSPIDSILFRWRWWVGYTLPAGVRGTAIRYPGRLTAGAAGPTDAAQFCLRSSLIFRQQFS